MARSHYEESSNGEPNEMIEWWGKLRDLSKKLPKGISIGDLSKGVAQGDVKWKRKEIWKKSYIQKAK